MYLAKIKHKKAIKKRLKIPVRIALSILLLLVVVSVLLSLSSVQTAMAKQATQYLNKKYGVSIAIDRVKVALLFGDVALRNVYVEDYRKDTLIYINKLETSILSARNTLKGNLKFGDMEVEELLLNMKTYPGEEKTNLDIFIAKLEASDTVSTSNDPFLLTSSRIRIKESRFRLIDENDNIPEILNFNHLNAEVTDFMIKGSDVTCGIDELAFTWNNGLVVKKIATDFSYAPDRMAFINLSIATLNSNIKGQIIFEYNRKDLSDFVNKVNINTTLDEAVLSTDEANLFYNAFGNGKKLMFSADFEGTLNELKALNVNAVSESTSIDGDFYFHNLLRKNAAFKMEAELRELSSNHDQLCALLPEILGNSLPPSLKRLGQYTVKGQTAITENTVNAVLEIRTGLGDGYSDIMLRNIQTAEHVTYEGFMALKGFHLGKFVNDKNLGRISLDADVEGQGFTRETLNTEVIGEVADITYNKYTYKDIEISGIFKDELFDGILITHDKNLKLDFKGLMDFSQQTNKLNFTVAVDHADLRKLNFVTRDSISVFKGILKMNMEGNTVDDLRGTVSFSKTEYTNQNDVYYFNDFNVTSTFNDDERILEIDSPDIITGQIKGKFYVNEVDKLVQNSIGSIYTNYSPYEIAPDQHLEFNLNIYNKIIEVFYPEVDFGKNTYIKGNMTADKGEFKLTFKSPHISVFDVVLDGIDFQIDNKNPLFNTYIEVDKVKTSVYDLADFELINTKQKDTLFFRTEFKGGDADVDAYNLNFYHTLNADEKSVVGLKKSDITFKNNQWFLNAEENAKNKVVINKTLDTISIEEIVMNHQNEQITLAGKLIDSTYKDIKLQFKEVSLDHIIPSVENLSLKGIINGNLNIFQTNAGYLPSSNMVIDNFNVNDNPLGTLNIGITGKDNLSKYDVDINIINNQLKSLDISGGIAIAGDDTVLDLRAALQDLNLEMFSPLGGDTITNIRGYASGNVAVSGSAGNPEVNGELFLNTAGMTIPYLNVDAALNDATRLRLYDQTFEFNTAVLSDTRYNTQALLNGTIAHSRFKDWYMDLRLDTQGDRFLVLDTEEDEDALYYGTGFMDGTATLYGYTDQLNIKVNAATKAGTSLKIPISDVAAIGDISYINFVDKNKKDTLTVQNELPEYGGLELHFDLDVTPDAEVEIVIDKKSGSTLKGTGAGNLLIEINTKGKFRMWGDFITYTGTYNFKYGGFVDKRFKVLPGGTINWEGDPFNAAIDMAAVYSLYANPAVLLDNGNFTRKVATDVEIQLEGNLEQIEPDFEIRFPGLNSVTNSELQYRLEEKDRRQLQALSLLSQGAFVSEVSITQQAFTGNLIQTASGLINEILNDSDGKFDVGIVYDEGGRNPDTDVQVEDRVGVTISTQISDRILVNGKIGVPVGGVTETVVAGDVEVQMLLNDDGSFSAKIFNKENEIQQFLADRQGYTQGVGLSYQVEFNTFKDLFKKLFKKAPGKQEKKDKETPVEAVGEGLINFSEKDKKKKSGSQPDPDST